MNSDSNVLYPATTCTPEHGFFTSNFQCVPEPATMALLALGGVASIRRRRAA